MAASTYVSHLYAAEDSLDARIVHHAAEAGVPACPAYEVLRLGNVSHHMSREQLAELGNAIGDYLAESQEELATTGELGALVGSRQ